MAVQAALRAGFLALLLIVALSTQAWAQNGLVQGRANSTCTRTVPPSATTPPTSFDFVDADMCQGMFGHRCVCSPSTTVRAHDCVCAGGYSGITAGAYQWNNQVTLINSAKLNDTSYVPASVAVSGSFHTALVAHPSASGSSWSGKVHFSLSQPLR